MIALRLIQSSPEAQPTSLSQSTRALDAAWEKLCAARDAFALVQHDNLDELFATQAAWAEAIGEFERARRRHRVAVKQANGRRWLRVVGDES